MVHLRLNDPDTSRNRHINYITALPQYANHEQAHHRLQQLAAQVQPVMKKHGFQINSLEEFEWNREFAGRNWNNGETVELVLRRQDGSFAPLQWVLMVFCHELAHIKYMNHIPSQHGKLDRELRDHCRQLQARGYYGDGFWSAGQRLEDNAFVAGSGLNSLQGLPEYSCGGAFQSKPSKARTSKRRRTGAGTGSRKRGFKGPSLHTGAQTAPNTRGGRRNQASLPGQGSRVDGNNHIPTASALSSSYKDDVNSTFRKRTQTASARELRAQAALRRLNASKTEEVETKPKREGEGENFWPQQWQDAESSSGPSTPAGGDVKEEEDDTESESETEDEGDVKDGGLVIRLDDSSADEAEEQRDALKPSASSPTGTVRIKQEQDHSTFASTESAQQRLNRARLYRQHQLKQGGTLRSTNDDWHDFCSIASLPTPSSTATTDSEGPTKKPMRNSKDDPIELLSSDDEEVIPKEASRQAQTRSKPSRPSPEQHWSCQVCTLLNPPTAMRCDACLTTRGSFLVGQ
ncbi:conserved hypothetical protein [Sporisorium reilianum SRZ2]|uniref:WLM domain-containing protein n=1 Tax=Sporisorium reilianum (strain SRZ2) TaxID=999809 RepID=E6ZN96_SPORE|nr:conserved hypothetical protein [Sporisorium reilianum SRZ2]